MMLKKHNIFFLFLSIGIIASLLFTSCKKDRSMDAIIIVKLKSSTLHGVAGAHVLLRQGDITASGYTDANGEYRHTFELPILLNVEVTKDTLKGVGSIGLGDPGTDVTKTIYIY